MAVAVYSGPRLSVDGRFFRLGDKKFYVKGVAYGPFPPNATGEPFASPEQSASDLDQIRELGANLVRVYQVPGKWFLDLVADRQLKVLIDIPWRKERCFLDSPREQAEARETVRRAVYSCARHPAIFAFSVANEIPPDVVRWSGARAIANFIDELVLEAKAIDPVCICTFTNYPPTEFLRPASVDFHCFNVYLHGERPFKNYLARLQMMADSKPLLLGEVGIDSLREGEAGKCQMLAWQIEAAFRGGLAGAVVFSYTDEWFKDGRLVEDWQMGLTTRDRRPKDSYRTVQNCFRAAPYLALPRYPKVSVIVACYNGQRTLTACLDSLDRLNYPDYEVILVDDGSTDATPQIASAHPKVRCLRHQENRGLSAARNTGIAAAPGEIVAFTDADCRADQDWLYYLVGDLLAGDFAGIGGPNLLPPEDSAVAAAVMVSPGGPAHVMTTDRQAEHIPGCNMAFYKWALEEAGGFDPIFHRAGDDVDLCWRLQQDGRKIGFSPSAFVWHYRRSTLPAYLRQQYGYGDAEAMLVRKHPERFNAFGGSLWHGRIYGPSKSRVLIRKPIIYRGLFGSAGFQTLYASEPAFSLMPCTALEYHVLVTLPLWVLAVAFRPLLPLALTSLLLSIGVCVAAGAQAALPKNKIRWWSRPLAAALFFLQPIVRGWARYQGRLISPPSVTPKPTLDSIALRQSNLSLKEIVYSAGQRVDRLKWVAGILRRLEQQGWPHKSDIGWSDYDVEIYGNRWCHLQLVTVAEDAGPRNQIMRCRLNGRWSLQAKAAFWALCAMELLTLGLAAAPRWRWLLLLTLPCFAWLIHRQKRNLQSLVVVFLDEAAKEWKMTRA